MAKSTGQTLTPDQIAALIRKHFPADMSEEDVRIGIAIVYAESGGNPTLRCGTDSRSAGYRPAGAGTQDSVAAAP